MAEYKINYIMPTWYTVTFDAPDNLTDEQVWEHMVEQKLYMEGEEAGWSRTADWWATEIENSEAESIVNLDSGETLYQIP